MALASGVVPVGHLHRDEARPRAGGADPGVRVVTGARRRAAALGGPGGNGTPARAQVPGSERVDRAAATAPVAGMPTRVAGPVVGRARGGIVAVAPGEGPGPMIAGRRAEATGHGPVGGASAAREFRHRPFSVTSW